MMSELTAPREPWREWPVWDLRVLEPADGRVVVLALAAGLAFDAGVHSGTATVGGTSAVLVAVAALLGSGRLRTAASRACVLAAAAISPFFLLRSSPWLVAMDAMGTAGLLVLAGALARDGRTFDLPARILASRAVVAAGHALGAAAFLLAPARAALRPRVRSARTGAIARGIAIALPLLLLLGALLASADAVFSSMLVVHVPMPADAAGHAVLVVIGALGVGAVLRTASAASGGELPRVDGRLGTIEWTVVLGALVALFSAFAVAQVVTLAGGARHVLETRGLTYAEYARTGYVQLLVAVGLTGVAVACLNVVAARPTPAARRTFAVLADLTIALTGVILVVAVRRLGLYEDAYGWTMLRLFAMAGAIWLGVTLLLAALRLGGVGHDRDWFLPAVAVAGYVVVLTLNTINPEAIVVRHNLAMGRELDSAYLAGELSDDAVPTIVAGLPSMAPETRDRTRALVCGRDAHDRGGLRWNRAAAAAAAARRTVCTP